jgi:hypothetical protein
MLICPKQESESVPGTKILEFHFGFVLNREPCVHFDAPRSRFGSPVAELRNRRIPTHLESCLMISADRVGIARNRAESRNRNRIAESFARGLVLRISTRKMTCSESRNCATALGSRATERREAASFSCLFFCLPFPPLLFTSFFRRLFVCARVFFRPFCVDAHLARKRPGASKWNARRSLPARSQMGIRVPARTHSALPYPGKTFVRKILHKSFHKIFFSKVGPEFRNSLFDSI